MKSRGVATFPPGAMRDTRRLLLLLDTAQGCDRQLLAGIMRHAGTKPEWRLYVRGRSRPPQAGASLEGK